MGNKNPPPDERVVYLALKNVFKGQEAQVRKSKTITKLIKLHKEQDAVAHLLREHNFDVICNLAGSLLGSGVFDSTLKAKVRFPELFDPSPTQSAEKEASEAEAARHEADAIRHATRLLPEAIRADDRLQQLDEVNVEGGDGERQLAAQSAEAIKVAAPKPSTGQMPSIFPIYLPFNVQHQLFVHLQAILEQACYSYGRRAMEDVLRDRGWDCPEAVELNHWVDEFLRKPARFEKSKDVAVPLKELLRSIANIRHTAVHRIRLNAKGMEKCLDDSERFLTLLDDTQHYARLAKLRLEVRATLEELGRNKHLIKARLDEVLRSISAQRAKLDHAERMAIAEMEREDSEYRALAGKIVEASIAPSESSYSTAVDAKKEDDTAYDTDSTNEYGDDDVQQEQEWDAGSCCIGNAGITLLVWVLISTHAAVKTTVRTPEEQERRLAGPWHAGQAAKNYEFYV